MPVPSFFKRKATNATDNKKPKLNEETFSGDDELLALHAETAELLRLVKTPVKGKTPNRRNGSPVKRAARKTIEVLEEDDEDVEQTPEEKQRGAEAPLRPRSSNGFSSIGDLFAFEAEEARVRKAVDTFVPDTSPSKRAVEAQRSHLIGEHQRLGEIKRREEVASERHEYEAQNRPVVNRIEDSAIKIQAHSRGFLARKHAEEDRRIKEEEDEKEKLRKEAEHWHEVRDIENNEVWFYNSQTGNSQWERPVCLAASESIAFTSGSCSTTSQSLPGLSTRHSSGPDTFPTLSRVASPSSSNDLPPLSPSTSRPSSSKSASSGTSARLPAVSGVPKARPTLPALGSTSYDYAASQSTPWECDSVAGSTSDQASLCSERLEDEDDDDMTGGSHDFSRGRRTTLPPQQGNDTNDDWQINDSLFLADGSKNSKLRDTIRSALQTSKFDSISSLVASNIVLRRKPTKGRHTQQQHTEDALRSPNQRGIMASSPSPSRAREIVLGRKEPPMFVAVLERAATTSRSPTTKPRIKRPRAAALPIGVDPSNPLRSTPQIRDLVDPGLYDDLTTKPQAARSPDKPGAATTICFNCWSSSNGRHCEAHQDASDFRKVKSAESALMCANWHLDQLRRKYRAEEIQEIFMKQNASLRYDKTLKQYITVIEARHPIYRLLEQLTTSWSKTMRRKLHTRAWFRSFCEQLRAGRVPKADASTPKLMKLKNTIQNNTWCSKYSDSVRHFHPTAPTTAKNQAGDVKNPIMDVIVIDPAHPQLRNWILKTDCTKPVELYRPRKYELPPRRCVPMPTPSFLDEIPLPVPNILIDCGHIASWFERLSARVCAAALNKAILQIQACSPPRGVTEARKTKHVTPVTVLFATFGRKPTAGMLAVGGLSAELLIHMLVTTYIPAQYGHFIVFERRAVAPLTTKDHDAVFVCLEIDPKTMEYVFRPLEHALNVRRPPTIILATKVNDTETEEVALRRFPRNRPEQTGEENGHGFRTFWLVSDFQVPDEVDSVAVQPTADVLSPNSTSMNATMTTKADRFYPFCIPTTKENTPIEYIHLLWIGQSSRNQPQTFTTLGAQQPGDFMKNSNPNGALGVCTSVIYRSWAYMQSSPYEEFTTDEGIAYWYDKQTGETFWSRPILPQEKHRGKDGGIDGVVVHGQGEVATLGVGVEEARYSQLDLRKYMTKKLEAPEEKIRRLKQVSTSAKKHELIVTLDSKETQPRAPTAANKSGGFARIEVPKLEFKKKPPSQLQTATLPKGTTSSSPQKKAKEAGSVVPTGAVDINTKQLIDTITQALGSALPALTQTSGAGSVDMLQLGIGLGMGLGLRTSQQQSATAVVPNTRRTSSRSTQRSRPRSADSQVTFADEIDEEEDDFDGEDAVLSTTRSEESSASNVSSTARSILSAITSVEASPSPDELELLPQAEREKLRAGYGEKTPGYRTHSPPGEGHTWTDKPVNASAASQTAVEGFGGALHHRVACLPKGFVEAVSSTKTCKMQANYLPVIKNTNPPRSVGIVRPRPALDEWLAVGYSPWSAGRAIFGTQFIKNLMQRPEIIAAQKSGANTSTASQVLGSTTTATAQVEKKENVTQAVKEAQQLETVFSLCRHGKYDELERMITSPDWTLDIDAKDVTGNTLLSIACQNNNKRIAKLCMRRGADINTQNLNGQTVLHYCHEYGFHDLMDYLLDKGARDDVVNADGLTCYEGLSKEAVDAL